MRVSTRSNSRRAGSRVVVLDVKMREADPDIGTIRQQVSGRARTVRTALPPWTLLSLGRRLPATQPRFQFVGDPQRDIFPPRRGRNLDADGQPASRSPAANHGCGPACHIVRHGVAVSGEHVVANGILVNDGGERGYRRQNRVVIAHK